MTTVSNNDMPMAGITTFTDADVLCGRGGMAQKHVGNKTYRALVNLNKQLYASCRTTEKIKISRSIVAAIREQKGRFLEKEANSDTFYDIGDKKAVEKTSQALREGQPRLKQKMAGGPTNLTAASTRTTVPGKSNTGPPPHQQHHKPYQPPPAPQEFAAGQQQTPPLDMQAYSRLGLNGIAEQQEYSWDPNEQQQQQQQTHYPQHPYQQQQQQAHARPTLATSGDGTSDMSLMSDISASFRHMMNDEGTRNSFDAAFQEAIRDIEVPDNPYYYGEEEGYAEMQPPPPRQMVEERMDSFRRQLMGIASPQVSQMSLSSTVGSSLTFSATSGGGGIRNSLQDATTTARESLSTAASTPTNSDIVVPPRDAAQPASTEYHFQTRREDAVDELLSVGGLSKLSLMSGMSESTFDASAIAGSSPSNIGQQQRMVHNGTSELTLDSALYPRGSSRRSVGHRGVSTRSAAMSEVSALDFLQEQENEDEDLDAPDYTVV